MIRFRLKLEPDDNGTVLVTSPDLPIATFGADEGEALRQARAAIHVLMESMISARDAVPIPSCEVEIGEAYHAVDLQTEMKLRLHNALLAAGLTRADLQRSLGWQRESIDRLFRLDHNSRLDQLEAAFKALGKGVMVSLSDAA